MNMSKIDVTKIRLICYAYGIYIWTSPFLIKVELSNTIYSLVISFISTCSLVYIMLHFKQALNIHLHSVKMDITIKYMVYMYIIAYALNVLALKDPQSILPYQAILGVGLVSLYAVYGFLLRNLDAPLEKLNKLKSLGLYSNCVLISLLMALTIVGVLFFILLMGFSYFLLGNLFVELHNLDDIKDSEEE